MKVTDVVDATDRRLLLLLQQDARRSVTELGRELNLSRTAVHARMSRLEKDGVIARYAAILREPALDGISAIVALHLSVKPCRPVLEEIKDWPEIVDGYSVAGPVDAMLIVRAGSTKALSKLTDRLRAVTDISDVEVTVILDHFASRTR